MNFSGEEERVFREILGPYLKHERVQRMNTFSQHGSITTYAHCYRVARFSFWLNRRLAINADESVLLPGAMLHDLFLYDWHIIGSMNPYHATNHAELACRNAVRYCNIDKNTQNVIRSHMWPINITKLPTSKEAWIVCMADKWCSLLETLFARRGMAKQGKKR